MICSVAGEIDPTVMLRYETGFSECANEVSRYLSSINGLHPDLRLRLMNHLAECITARTNNSRITAVPDSLLPPPPSFGEIVRLPPVTSQLLSMTRDSSSLLPVLLSHNSLQGPEEEREAWNGSDVDLHYQPIRNVRTTQVASDWSVLRTISGKDKWRHLADNNNNSENIVPCANSHSVRIKRRGRGSCSRNCSLSSEPDVVREEGSDPTTSGQSGVKDEPVWRPW